MFTIFKVVHEREDVKKKNGFFKKNVIVITDVFVISQSFLFLIMTNIFFCGVFKKIDVLIIYTHVLNV